MAGETKPKRKAGRPSFDPTDEQRRLVSALAGYGAPQEYICGKIINPQTEKPIDKKSLEKHFRAELDAAMQDTDLKMVESLFIQGVGRPAQYDKGGKLVREELKPSVAAAIFWTKARLGWSERVVHDHNMHFDLSKLNDEELALYEQLARKAAVTGAVRAGEEATRH